jgi:starvation-inducible DNA-binding protein
MSAVGKLDPVTEDSFIQLIGDLEKEHWMFVAENGA